MRFGGHGGWLELGAGIFVEFGQGEVGFDFREGDDGVESGVVFESEAAFGFTAVENDLGCFGLDEEEDFEGGDGEVGVAFFSLIGAAGGVAEDLDDDDRVVLEVVGGGIWEADDHGVWIVEAGLVVEFDADFGVAIEGSAGFSAELCAGGEEGVGGDGVVEVAAAGHGVKGAAEVFVFHLSHFLSGEVVLDGGGVVGGGHGRA